MSVDLQRRIRKHLLYPQSSIHPKVWTGSKFPVLFDLSPAAQQMRVVRGQFHRGHCSCTRDHFLPLSVSIVDCQGQEINREVHTTDLRHHLLANTRLFLASCESALNYPHFMHTDGRVNIHKGVGNSVFLLELLSKIPCFLKKKPKQTCIRIVFNFSGSWQCNSH